MDDKTRTILAANPSFITEDEQVFWTQFERVVDGKGWQLVKHAMRNIPKADKTVILPARLVDVARFLPALPSHLAGALPDWFPEDRFRTIVEWELRRWGKPLHDPLIDGGLFKLAWHVDGLFRHLKPACTMFTNKIDHGVALFQWAARHYGSQEIFFERSPLGTFWVEPVGMFAESGIWEAFEARDTAQDDRYRAIGHRSLDLLRENPEGFRQQTHKTALAERQLQTLEGPIVFLPMDNVLWTGWSQPKHWQFPVDYGSDALSPRETIGRLSEIVERQGGTLVVKLHPSDVEPYSRAFPSVIFLETSLDLLISVCDVCVTFLTKVAFVSVAMGKPTLTLAANTAAASGATFHTMDPDAWEETFLSALACDRAELEQRAARMALLLGWADQEYFVSAGKKMDLSRPNTLSLFESIAASPTGRKSYGTDIMKQQTQTLISRIKSRRAWTFEAPAAEADQTLYILFDVSRLANTRLRHSGISRYALNLFDALRRRDDVKVIPVLSHKEILNRGEFRDSLESMSKYLSAKIVSLAQAVKSVEGCRAVYFSPYDPLLPLEETGNIPRIVTIHDVLHMTQSELYLQDAAASHIERVLSSITPLDMITADSEYTRMQVLRVFDHPPENITTVRLGVDAKFKPEPAQSVAPLLEKHGLTASKYFVVFAQNDPRKNFPMTFAAVSEYITANPDADTKFVIVCSAVHMADFLAELDVGGALAEHIVLVTAPTDKDLVHLYSAARGLLYVSLGEGFGLPPLEAMACGCPVITSSVTSVPEVVGDGGIYVDAYKRDHIVNAIKMLANSNSLYETLSVAALSQSADFTWENTAQEMIQVADALEKRFCRDIAHSGDEVLLQDGWTNIISRASEDWTAYGSEILPTGRIFNTGDDFVQTITVSEGYSDAIHRIEKRAQTPSKHVVASVILRPDSRNLFRLWVQPMDGEKAQSVASIIVDLQSGEMLKNETEEGVFILDSRIEPLDAGWLKVSMECEWTVQSDGIRLSANPKVALGGTNKYAGQAYVCFEIADAVVLVQQGDVQGDPDEAEPTSDAVAQTALRETTH